MSCNFIVLTALSLVIFEGSCEISVGELDLVQLYSELYNEEKDELCKPYATEAKVTFGQHENRLFSHS